MGASEAGGSTDSLAARVRAAFEREGQRHSIGFAELDATTTLADAAGGKHYFYLEIAESAATPRLHGW